MKYRFLFLLLSLVLISFIGWRLFSVKKGDSPASTLPVGIVEHTSLLERSGTVEVQLPNTHAWQPAVLGMELPSGTHLRTGSDGAATVRVFDQSENRLAPSTEVTLFATSTTPEHHGTEVEWRVETGELWSRVLRLLDLSDRYAVSSGEVVATVRGTAFRVKKMGNQTEMTVLHGVLETAKGFIPDRFTWSFSGSAPVHKALLSDAWFNDGWVVSNRVKDEEYAGGRMPIEPIATNAAERLYVRFVGLDQAFDDVFQSEALIPLIPAQKLAEWTQILEEGERAMRDLPADTNPEERETLTHKVAALHARLDAARASQSATTNSVLFEGTSSSTSSTVSELPSKPATGIPPKTPATAPSAAIPTVVPVVVPGRLSCSSVLVTVSPDVLQIGQKAIVFVQAVQGIQSYTDVTKIAALSVTDAAAFLQGNVVEFRREGAGYVEARVPCDGQIVVGRASIKTAPIPPTLQSLGVASNQYTLTFGGRAQLTAQALYSDGSQKDVSANTAFSLADGSFGSIAGNVFYASGQKTGTVVVNAIYSENGKTVLQKIQITIRSPLTQATVAPAAPIQATAPIAVPGIRVLPGIIAQPLQ